jgi:hypothetical protein
VTSISLCSFRSSFYPLFWDGSPFRVSPLLWHSFFLPDSLNQRLHPTYFNISAGMPFSPVVFFKFFEFFFLLCWFLHCFLFVRYFLGAPNPPLALHDYRYLRLHRRLHPSLRLFPVLLLLGRSSFPCPLIEVPCFFIFVTFLYSL